MDEREALKRQIDLLQSNMVFYSSVNITDTLYLITNTYQLQLKAVTLAVGTTTFSVDA